LCWRTAVYLSFDLGVLFISFLELVRIFRPSWTSDFLYTDKESNQRNPPHRVGLRLLCALQFRPALRNSLSLKQSSLYPV